MTLTRDIEQAIIGAVLWDAAAAFDEIASERLTADCFSDCHAATLFRWAAGHNANGRPVNTPDAIRENKGIPQEYIEACIEHHVTMAHVRHHASTLRAEAIGRAVIKSAKAAIQALEREGVDIEQERSRLEMAVANMAARKYSTPTTGELIDAAIEDWRRVKASHGGCVGVRTGFSAIDIYFGGILKSAFYVLSGSPGSCKTTLARNIIENVCEMGMPVAMLSLEQTGSQIVGAMAARYARQSVFYLNFGHAKANPEDVAGQREFVASLPFRIEDKPHTISEVQSWYRREAGKGARLIVIDYIQRIQPDREMTKLSDEGIMRRVSTALADLAKDTEVPVLAISALSRNGHLRGSGVIDYDAYCHLRMDKAEDFAPDNLRYVAHFEKQRFGPPCNSQYFRLLGDEGRLMDEHIWEAMNDKPEEDHDEPTGND